MIILDTNVISAIMRPALNSHIVRWVDGRTKDAIWTSAITIMEIRSGLIFMPEGRRRSDLSQGFEDLLTGPLSGRVLPFDQAAAEAAAVVDFTQNRRGRNIEIGDIQIAGIALAHRATLATRNIKDFADLDIPLVDPWAA